MFIDKAYGEVARRQCSYLPSILDELDPHTLANAGVRLLRLDAYLLDYNPLRLWRTLQRVCLLL